MIVIYINLYIIMNLKIYIDTSLYLIILHFFFFFIKKFKKIVTQKIFKLNTYDLF